MIALASAAVLVALAIGGYQLGWWLKAENVDRQVRIDNISKGTQTAWHDQAISGIRDYSLVDPENTAARGALRNQTCDLIARLTNTFRDDIIVTFENKECK